MATGALDLKTIQKMQKEEALYLMDLRNAECTKAGKTVSFNDSISKFWNNRKFIARYLTYKVCLEEGAAYPFCLYI